MSDPMPIEFIQLKGLLELLSNHGVKSFKNSDYDIQFGDKIKTEFTLPKGGIQGLETERMPTEDELLFMSAGEVEAKPPEI